MSDQLKKKDAGKPRLHLVPDELVEGAAEAFNFGTQKYRRYAWQDGGGMEWSRIRDAAERHLRAFWRGEEFDPESGVHHLAHLAANVGMLIAHLRRGLGKDDRFSTNRDPDGPKVQQPK